MITSCSPGWINYAEGFYPELLDHLSTCKSPQQMFGAVAKTYYAKKAGIDPADIFTVSVMPCTAKKFECKRPEMNASGYRDVDVALTTRAVSYTHLDVYKRQLSDKPKGKYVIQVCNGPCCKVMKYEKIKDAIEKELKTGIGEITHDGMFSFEYSSCFGACEISPAIRIGEKIYGNLDEKKDVYKRQAQGWAFTSGYLAGEIVSEFVLNK